ncbi:hypothetical protein JOC33_002142 [Thalassobacillus pellis]|nr:hypothetical protein [Thalassobacillus pellis]
MKPGNLSALADGGANSSKAYALKNKRGIDEKPLLHREVFLCVKLNTWINQVLVKVKLNRLKREVRCESGTVPPL